MINQVTPTQQGVNGIGSMSSVWAVVEAARAGAADAREAAANALPPLLSDDEADKWIRVADPTASGSRHGRPR